MSKESTNYFRQGLGQLQEAVGPAKRRRVRYAQFCRSQTNDQPPAQRILLLPALGLLPQPGQRRLAQCVEPALASPALEALQAAGPAVANNPRAGAMWASRRLGEPRLHEMLDLGLVVPDAQRLAQIGLLGRCQPRHRRQPPLQFCRIHRKPRMPATRGHKAKSDTAVAHGVTHHELTRKEPYL